MEEKKQKRVLTIELDENVKKVSITGLGDDETVVMKQELSEEELDQATGGSSIHKSSPSSWTCHYGGTIVINDNGCNPYIEDFGVAECRSKKIGY